MSDKLSAVTNLRVIAAVAEKLANDLQSSSLWPGDFADSMAQIQKAVRDMPSIR